MKAPMSPPTIGNTMKTHSCSRAQPRWNTAVAIDRAGFTDVLSIGIEMRWMSVSASPTTTPVIPGAMDFRDVLAMMKMNTPVNTISAMIAAPSENPPGEWVP